mmetsp:Transcript_116494/g.323857  ORF Transcript_116494/g.323857 Transcript_116494/m.323857 type:complete len:307 (+) Transcript_116494:327-1247(+)
MPVAVMTNSPWRRGKPSASSATGLTGWPANSVAKRSLQPGPAGWAAVGPMSKPQLAGCSGATSTPRAASHGAQAPSEPSCGHEAPPSASSVAVGVTRRSPSGVAKRSAPIPGSAAQPVQRWRIANLTPAARSRCSQARSSGAAFRSAGNTRPELPTKVSTPSPAAQARSASASKLRSSGSICAARAPKRPTKGSKGSECVRFSPPLPASRNLRPTLGLASNTVTAWPAAASTSAAIRPAGPPPMMATSIGALMPRLSVVDQSARSLARSSVPISGLSMKGSVGLRPCITSSRRVCTPARAWGWLKM